MHKLSLLAEYMNGILIGDDLEIDDFLLDSREEKINSLFVAIKGEHVDSHNFLEGAKKSGAIAFLIEDDKFVDTKLGSFIVVKDTKKALIDAAYKYRKILNTYFIGVTGSVGKTSTKEMIYFSLKNSVNIFKTKGNMNSDIGLPIMVLNINKNVDIAVLEFGVSQVGDMELLNRICPVDIAVITNIGVSHIEFFKTKENILNEKVKIVSEYTKKIFYNADDELLLKYFKNNDKAEGYFDIDYNYINEKIEFEYMYNFKKEKFLLSVLGKHNIKNAVVSIKICNYLSDKYNINLENIKKGIYEYKPLNGRGNIIHTKDLMIIDETYNASIDSVKAGFEMLNDIITNKSKIIILGSMLELGEQSENIHKEIITLFKKYKFDKLLLYGKEFSFLNDNEETIIYFNDKNDIIKYIQSNIVSSIVYVKGSRGMKMEDVVNAIC